MTRKSWLRRFSLAARWWLPPQEAAEAIGDYRELLAERGPEADESLLQELGGPLRAAWILGTRREVLAWTAVFAVLCGFLLSLTVWLCAGGRLYFFSPYPALFLLALCLGLSLFLRCRGMVPKGKRFPAALLWTQAGLLALAALTAGWVFFMVYDVLYSEQRVLLELLPPELLGPAVSLPLQLTAGLAACAGSVGVFLSRVHDRRWLGLFLLGTAILTACLWLLGIFAALSDPEALLPALRKILIPAAIGLAGVVWLQC